jgi:hypothetical protein
VQLLMGLVHYPDHITILRGNQESQQITNLVTVQGEQKPMVWNVMTLKSCSPIVGASVMPFDSEREVLLAWRAICHQRE